MTYLKINGITVPQPSTLQVDLQDIDSSETGRNQAGKLIRDRVVGGANAKRKVSCTWRGLSMTDAATLLQAMSASKFSVYYPDPYTGSFQTKTMYVGDRSAPIFHNGANASNKIVWESISANFVEF